MNSVVLMGRLTNDPELQYGQTENSDYVRFTVACDRRFKSKNPEAPTADFISCTAFGKTAQFISNYFQKGSRILVSGSIQTGSYTNRDNQKVFTTTVNVDNAEFCDSKGNNGGNNNNAKANSGNARSGNSRQTAGTAKKSNMEDDFINVPSDVEDDALPFN